MIDSSDSFTTSRPAAAVAFVLAAAAIGHALQLNDGFYTPAALAWVAGALVLACVGVATLRGPSRRGQTGSGRLTTSIFEIALYAGIAWQLIALATARPARSLETSDLTLFRWGVTAQALGVALSLARPRWLRRAWFLLVLGAAACMGAWVLYWAPSPPIDVITVTRAAIRALVHRRNPYDISFPNIYGNTGFYNPALVAHGRVMFGYPYPPLTLLLTLPGQVLANDFRYATLASLIAAAALIAWIGRDRRSALCATLLLTTPRAYFVLEQGWTEPVVVALLALTAASFIRRREWVPWTAGLLLVTKQYFALGVPLLVRVARREPGGPAPFLGRALVAGVLVTVPIAVWRPGAFVHSVVLLQFGEPLRLDSLSFVSLAARAGFHGGSIGVAIGVAVLVLVAVFFVTPNTGLGFVASLTLVMFTAFAFGSKAFCNYYFLVIGGLCVSAALACAAEAPRVAELEQRPT